MANFHIKVSESGNGINKICTHLRRYTKNLPGLVETLVAEGTVYAQERAPQYTGELVNSITGTVISPDHGIIVASAPYAKYVEYGTGVVGAGSPHKTYDGGYDLNGHGVAGWTYFNPNSGHFQVTRGMKSSAFMYKTRKHLQSQMTRYIKRKMNSGK